MKFRPTYSENVTYTADVEADDFQQAREEADDIVNSGGADYESNGIEFEDIEYLGKRCVMKIIENYLGISGLMLIWYNSQDDNELVYDGIHMDYVDIQSAVYERYCEECGADSYSDDAYDSWLKSNLDYIVDEMLLMGDWLFDNKTVGHGRFHSYLEPWKYKQMLGKTKEKEAVA